MGTLREVGKIQVHEDLAFQRVEWRFQCVGWIGMGVFLALGLLGGFGRSMLAKGRRDTLAVSCDSE
jgi:hypothetical protein